MEKSFSHRLQYYTPNCYLTLIVFLLFCLLLFVWCGDFWRVFVLFFFEGGGFFFFLSLFMCVLWALLSYNYTRRLMIEHQNCELRLWEKGTFVLKNTERKLS